MGTRLGKLTKDKTKCMIDIAGKPCLEWVVEKFENAGIKKIIVNTHYRPLDIMEHFGDRLLYTFEPELLGENNTLNGLEKWLKNETVFVCNGDTLSDISLDVLLNLSLNYETSVKHIDKGVYAGYSILHPHYFNGDKNFISLTTDATWVDIGSPKELKLARKLYENDRLHIKGT